MCQSCQATLQYRVVVFEAQIVHIVNYSLYQSSCFIDNVQRVTKKQTLRPILQVFNNRSHLQFGSVLWDGHQGLFQKCPDPMALG
jgi:hypothetical protein